MDAAEPAIRHHDNDVAIASFSGDGLDDRVDIREVTRTHVLPGQIFHEFRFRQSFVRRQARAKHRRNHNFVGTRKRLRKVFLKNAPAR